MKSPYLKYAALVEWQNSRDFSSELDIVLIVFDRTSVKKARL